MQVHGNGIYNTVPLSPYEENNIVYLQSGDGKRKFIYVLADANNDEVRLPSILQLNNYAITKGSKIKLVDAPSQRISWKPGGRGTSLIIPASLQNKVAGKYAVAFEVTQ